MPKTVVIFVVLFLQTIIAEGRGHGNSTAFDSEPVFRQLSFSAFSQSNCITSFTGSFFRKQRGKYKQIPTSEFEAFREWIPAKVAPGKKPLDPARLALKNKSEHLPLMRTALVMDRQHQGVYFSNCYGSLYRLSPF